MYLSIRLGRTRIRSTHTRFPGHDLFLSTERRKHEETGGGVMEKKEEQQELEDERREAAIASTPSLQPNFKPKRGITQAQLSKLQVLFPLPLYQSHFISLKKGLYFLQFFIAEI